jgi:hypothetical protein
VDIQGLISELGFPIASAVAGGGALWAVMRWVMLNLHREIGDLHLKLDNQHSYIIKLIDRIRMLEDDIVRTHVLVAAIHELRIPLERIGRAKKDDE